MTITMERPAIVAAARSEIGVCAICAAAVRHNPQINGWLDEAGRSGYNVDDVQGTTQVIHFHRVDDSVPPAWLPVEAATTSVTEVVAAKLKPAPPKPRTVDWRARELDPGLLLTHEVADETVEGGYRYVEPLRIESLENWTDTDGQAYVRVRLDNGWAMSFEPDEKVEVQCVVLPCPSWCQRHNLDSDGTLDHFGAEYVVEFTDEGGTRNELSATLHRMDDPDGTIADDTSAWITMNNRESVEVTPIDARSLGTMFAQIADDATSPNLVDVESIRLGDQIRHGVTDFETVTVLVHDGQCQEVAIYTTSDDDPAMRCPLGTSIEVRRGGVS